MKEEQAKQQIVGLVDGYSDIAERAIAALEVAAAKLEAARAKLKQAERALETAELIMQSKGWWRNEAGYLTDAALWIDKAQNAIRQTESMG